MAFRYENPGYREKTYIIGYTVEDLTGEKTRTGVAFYQPDYNNSKAYKQIVIPSLPEIWIKFDVYRKSTNWRLLVNTNSYHTGFYDDGTLHCVVDGSRVANAPDNTNGLHTILVHLTAGNADTGIFEYWYDGEKINSYTGKINGGSSFTALTVQADNANTLFSNIIVSEEEIGFDENTTTEESCWIQPMIYSNGTFGESDLAVKSGGGADSNAYAIFNASYDYVNKTNADAYIDIFVKKPLLVYSMYLYSESPSLPASGKLYFSDDGENWTECGTWADPDCTGTAELICEETNKHSYWRLYCLDRAAGKTNNADISNVNIYATATNKTIVEDTFDTCRIVNNIVTADFDTCRKINNVVEENFDTLRRTKNIVEAEFDTLRILRKKIIVEDEFDTCRNVYRTVTADFDTERRIKNTVTADFDTCRKVIKIVEVDFDTCRKLNNTVTIDFDTRRLIPRIIAYKPDVPTQDPKTPDNRLVSAQISIKEQTICDDITLEIANSDLTPHDPIKGSLLDYDFSDYIVKSTSHKNITMTINSMIDWKKYTTGTFCYPTLDKNGKVNTSKNTQPRIKITSWGAASVGGQYLKIVGGETAGSPYSYKQTPTTDAKSHLKYIASVLGLSDSVLLFDNYFPSNGSSGDIVNCMSMLSNIVAWSKELPWRQINAFIRDNVLYAIQRGQEPNEIDITNMRKSRPQIQREVIAINKTLILPTGVTTQQLGDYYLVFENNPHYGKDDKGNLTRYNCGDTDVYLEYDYGAGNAETGRLTQQRTRNADGSEEIVKYEYFNKNTRYEQVKETHIFIDKNGHREESEMWHTVTGNGREITSRKENNAMSGSTLTSNRGAGLGYDNVVGSWSIAGSRDFLFTYYYQLHDSFGNHAAYKSESELNLQIFPIYSHYQEGEVVGWDDIWATLFYEILAYNKKIQETISLDLICPVINGVPEYQHIIDFRDRIIYNGNTYYLVSNTAKISSREFKQSVTMVRWY